MSRHISAASPPPAVCRIDVSGAGQVTSITDPYAQSAALFGEILGSPRLRERAAGALVVWEIPDAPGSVGEFLKQPLLADRRIRKFGGTDFLLGEVPV